MESASERIRDLRIARSYLHYCEVYPRNTASVVRATADRHRVSTSEVFDAIRRQSDRRVAERREIADAERRAEIAAMMRQNESLCG